MNAKEAKSITDKIVNEQFVKIMPKIYEVIKTAALQGSNRIQYEITIPSETLGHKIERALRREGYGSSALGNRVEIFW